MNAIKLLKQDHRTVEALFKQYEKAGDGAYKLKQRIAKEVIKELAVHAAIEEALLYPASRTLSEKIEDQVLEALEEHHVVKWTLTELEKMSPEDERFDAKMTVLMESVRHHVKEEEGILFPTLEKRMGKSQLEAIGAALEQGKKVVPTHPHPMAPDSPPGNIISDALAKILDAGKDAIGKTVKTAKAALKSKPTPRRAPRRA